MSGQLHAGLLLLFILAMAGLLVGSMLMLDQVLDSDTIEGHHRRKDARRLAAEPAAKTA